jgi:hypothetical protein
VVTAEDNLSCYCDTQQDAHHEDSLHGGIIFVSKITLFFGIIIELLATSRAEYKYVVPLLPIAIFLLLHKLRNRAYH